MEVGTGCHRRWAQVSLRLMGLSGNCSRAMSAPWHSLQHHHAPLLHWCLERDLWDYTMCGSQSSCISQQTYQTSPAQVQHDGVSVPYSAVSCPHCCGQMAGSHLCLEWPLPAAPPGAHSHGGGHAVHPLAQSWASTLQNTSQGGLHTRCWKPLEQRPLTAVTMRLPQTLRGFN